MGKVRWPCMLSFQNNNIFSSILFVVVLLISNSVLATSTAKKRINLSGLFANELSSHGSAEITSNPEYCISKIRPLTISQEVSEILSYAIQYSENLKARSECKKIKGDERKQFCRFYLYSPNNTEQWSIGFTFLGDILNGKIDLDSLECFGTP